MRKDGGMSLVGGGSQQAATPPGLFRSIQAGRTSPFGEGGTLTFCAIWGEGPGLISAGSRRLQLVLLSAESEMKASATAAVACCELISRG